MRGTDIYFISGAHRSAAVRGPFMSADLNADSLPDFDSWGPDQYWSCEAFRRWHELMESKYGRAIANAKFLTAWETAWTFGSYHQNCCQEASFRTYFKSRGLDIDTLTCALLLPVVDATSNVLDSTNDLSQGLNAITKVVKTAAPFIAIGAGIWAIDKWIVPIFPRKNGNRK